MLTYDSINNQMQGLVKRGTDKLHDLEQNLDDRLFPDHPLYCEGMAKPKMRGMIHFVYSLVMVAALFHIFLEANGNPWGQFAGLVFVLSNLYCVGVSAAYHIGNWSVSGEILIQKLDHCGIAIYAAGVNFPVSFLLLPWVEGKILLFLTVTTCAWTCWHISNNRPAVWRFLIVSSMILLFFPSLYYRMTSFEFGCAIANAIVQGIGMAVFVNRKPDPWPSFCGYHELFHFICVIGMTITYLCNWSVVRRTCNPYAHHIDVLELLWALWVQPNSP
jgi:hemolysin III